MFMQAEESTLLKRYSETRRRHPLTDFNIPLKEALKIEREMLTPIARHDAGNSGYGQHIAFFMPAFDDQLECFRPHFNIAFSDGCALGDRFITDIDHMGFAGLIKMG